MPKNFLLVEMTAFFKLSCILHVFIKFASKCSVESKTVPLYSPKCEEISTASVDHIITRRNPIG